MIEVREAEKLAEGLGFTIHDRGWGERSSKALEGVHPRLILIASLAIRICEWDGTVLNLGGVRTEEQARRLGKVDSQHRIQSDGFGHAIDLIPIVPGVGVSWAQEHLPYFRAMQEAVKVASAIYNQPIRQGCDWDMDDVWAETGEWDWPHFEIPKAIYTPRAIELLTKRRAELSLGDDRDAAAAKSLNVISAELSNLRNVLGF